MDFFPNLLHLAILCVSLSLIFLIWKQNSTRAKLPPGRIGWPIIGETLKYAMAGRRGTPDIFINGRMTKYSQDLFKTSLFGEKMVVFCGASGNKFLFSNENKIVTSWWPRSVREVVISRNILENFSDEDSLKARKVIVEFLKPEALQRFIPVMDSMAKEHFEKDWSPFKEVKVLPLTKKYTFTLACRLFLNIRDPNKVSRLSALFAPITDGLMSVPINIPGTAFNRALNCSKGIHQELLAVIRERRKELSENEGSIASDLLTQSVLALDENGIPGVNEMMIAIKIMGLLVASHDSTSSSITLVLKYLAELPHVYSEVLKEQMKIARSKGPNDLLNWDDINKMKYSWNVVSEVMRLTPPSQGGFREAIGDFTYASFTIPKGWKTYWTPYSTHKDPKYFPDPEKFDPSRFEGNGPAPYTFVPFGGGPRMCPGREYARLEILVFMHNVVTRFMWEKAIPDEKITSKLAPVPVDGLPVYLKLHKY